MRMAHSCSSTQMLAKQRQFFMEGKHTDVVIRVRITEEEQQSPPVKRQRIKKAEATAAPAEDHYIDIKAHVLVLSARSQYFDRCLRGEWAEALERRVELEVEDEQELEDLQLLIKLSYADSYTHSDDGQLLPLDTRLRLAVRADALEFVEAVDAVVASLNQGMNVHGAVKCLEELPPALERHTGVVAVRKKAAAVLCGHLGRVAGMFKEATVLHNGDTLPLCEYVKQLSPFVLKRLLLSEALQLQLENEAYALLVTWLEQSPHVPDEKTRLAFFKALAPVLRYHHMTTDFLANVVCTSSLMQKSGRLLSSVVSSAIVQRDASRTLVGQKTGKRDRGVGASEALMEIKASFTLQEVAALEPGSQIEKWCGLVAGYPGRLRVERETEEGNTLGAYFGLRLTSAAIEVDDTLAAGVGLKYKLTLSPEVKIGWVCDFYSPTAQFWGYPDVFDKPWAEAVREGSPHFPGGKLEFKATVKLVTGDRGGGGGGGGGGGRGRGGNLPMGRFPWGGLWED